MKDYNSRVTFRTTEQLYSDLHIVSTLAGYHTFNDFMNDVMTDYVEHVLPPDLRSKCNSLKNPDVVG